MCVFSLKSIYYKCLWISLFITVYSLMPVVALKDNFMTLGQNENTVFQPAEDKNMYCYRISALNLN